MVEIELSGAYHEPAPSEIMRTGGDSHSGVCALEAGDEVPAY
jgi:hypothetical protein